MRLSAFEGIDFTMERKGIDTIRIRVPYHHIHDAITNGDISMGTTKGLSYSPRFRALHSKFWALFKKIYHGSKEKAMSPDAEWMHNFGLQELRDDFGVVTLEANYESTNRSWTDSAGHERKDPPAPYIRIVIDKDDFEYAYRLVLDKVPCMIAEFSLHKFLAQDLTNLDKRQNYSQGLRTIICEMSDLLVFFVESYFSYRGKMTGSPLLGRIDLMADIELDCQKDLSDFLKAMKQVTFNDCQQVCFVEGYTVKYQPKERGIFKGKSFFRNGQILVPTEIPKPYWLPKVQYYDKSAEIFNRGKGPKVDEIILRGEEQFHSGNDIFKKDPLVRELKQAVGSSMIDYAATQREVVGPWTVDEHLAIVPLEELLDPIYNKYDLVTRAREGLAEAQKRAKLPPTPSVRDLIIAYLETQKKAVSGKMVQDLNVSRDLLYYHLKILEKKGIVELQSRRYWGLTQAYLSRDLLPKRKKKDGE